MKIAHRFIGGIGSDQERQSVKRTVEYPSPATPGFISRPLHGLGDVGTSYPALKCWATFTRPLRGLRQDGHLNIPDFSNWKDHDSFEREFAKLLRDLKATEKWIG
jgi:hypothetical protein